ncbi:unnamed protein product [Heligmosomoides polygyrus]|uniref:DUF7083 domain-containing protein n=1 Tax=Heligmosomoides polygyrus TaxID=6339 RepID=A0A3P8DQS6_HELPZ|nr:unnamed protein product [Heligmosomoides polygyrus]
MEALPAILQAVQQQLEVQGAALRQLMEKLCAVSTNSSSAGAAVMLRDKHAIFDSLYRRIETFNYDPDRGRTFGSWLRRYKDLFDNECIELDGKDKTRLLVSRLDEDCHRMLTSAIFPKQPSDLPWEEVVQVLNRLFGTAKTLFRRRFECFRVRYEGQDFNNYETMVKAKCTDAHFDSIDFDGLQFLGKLGGNRPKSKVPGYEPGYGAVNPNAPLAIGKTDRDAVNLPGGFGDVELLKGGGFGIGKR